MIDLIQYILISFSTFLFHKGIKDNGTTPPKQKIQKLKIENTSKFFSKKYMYIYEYIYKNSVN